MIYYNFNEVISIAPGPSPWYLISAGPKLFSKHGSLSWKKAGEKEIMIGKVLLETPNENPLAIFDFYCYVLNLKGSNFLVWYVPEERILTPYKPSIQIKLLDADKLVKIGNIEKACGEMNRYMLKVLHNNEALICSFGIPLDLNLGTNKLEFPRELREMDELLILAESKSITKKKLKLDQMNIAIYILKPKENSIEIIPQDWFNYGNYDFDYQWITRVTRDPITGKIFGEGIRLGSFVLDSSGRKIEKWIINNPAYHPEYKSSNN